MQCEKVAGFRIQDTGYNKFKAQGTRGKANTIKIFCTFYFLLCILYFLASLILRLGRLLFCIQILVPLI
jgi:hypothetical protein